MDATAHALARLERGLDEANDCAGQLFLLAGARGVGKTRLCDAVAMRAVARDFSVHWGRCWEPGGAPAYWPWMQVLSRLLAEVDVLPDALTAAPEALGLVLPELGAELRVHAAGRDDDEHDSAPVRFRAYRAALGLLAQACRRRPALLVLDDLHAADAPTLLLLRFVARELRGLRLVVLGTYRDDAARDLGLLADVAREGVTLALGRETAPAPTAGPAFELRREADHWSVISAEGVLRLRPSRGLEVLHRLLSRPDEEMLALELAALGEGGPEAGTAGDAGDTGVVIDAEARAAYRARLERLEDEIAEAEAFGDRPREARARAEIEQLAAELSRAVGLSGRVRRAGSARERARIAVQKRLREVVRRIGAGAPALGRYLSLTVQTGTYCAYRPTRAPRAREPE